MKKTKNIAKLEEKLMDARVLLYKAHVCCITKEKDENLGEMIQKFLFSLPDRYWYCPTCNEEVPGYFVTYNETPDPRHGCGNQVIPKFRDL